MWRLHVRCIESEVYAFRLSDPRIADVLLAVSRGAAKGLLTVTDRTALWPTTATNRPMDTSAPVTCVFADLNTWQLYAGQGQAVAAFRQRSSGCAGGTRRPSGQGPGADPRGDGRMPSEPSEPIGALITFSVQM